MMGNGIVTTPPARRPARRAPTGPLARRRAAAAALVLVAVLPCAALAQQRYWYDGAVRRTLWAQPGLVAEFGDGGLEKSRVVKPAALAKDASGPASPVFRDGPGDAGAPRALPGGVVLRLPPGTDDARRQAIFSRHGLNSVRPLGDGGLAWFAWSPPGSASLDLANRLYESGDFASAAPNWWQPRALK